MDQSVTLECETALSKRPGSNGRAAGSRHAMREKSAACMQKDFANSTNKQHTCHIFRHYAEERKSKKKKMTQVSPNSSFPEKKEETLSSKRLRAHLDEHTR
eukprot:1162013-Pelagomonas_calceolata.AAC.9